MYTYTHTDLFSPTATDDTAHFQSSSLQLRTHVIHNNTQPSAYNTDLPTPTDDTAHCNPLVYSYGHTYVTHNTQPSAYNTDLSTPESSPLLRRAGTAGDFPRSSFCKEALVYYVDSLNLHADCKILLFTSNEQTGMMSISRNNNLREHHQIMFFALKLKAAHTFVLIFTPLNLL